MHIYNIKNILYYIDHTWLFSSLLVTMNKPIFPIYAATLELGMMIMNEKENGQFLNFL